MSESVTLLQRREVSKDNNISCCINYRAQRIRSKGAIFCLLVRLLLVTGNQAMIYAISGVAVAVFSDYLITYLVPVFMLLSPIAGWIVDAWLGRHRVIKVGIWTCLVGNILAVSATLISYTSHSMFCHKFFEVLAYIGLSVSMFGDAAITANVIQLSLDQCLGASGDELSALIQWNVWTSHFTHCIFSILIMSIPRHLLQQVKFTLYIIASISIVFSITTTIIFYIGKCWLNITHQVTNLIKLIAQVLNYAKKNKYPKHRSALTYWEVDYPSRLDLGKEKYGGPFSEEDVEDVRTVLQFTPLLLCAMLYYLPVGKMREHWFNYIIPGNAFKSLYLIISVTPNIVFTV